MSQENSEGTEITEAQWITINSEYILPRNFFEQCVVYIQRSGSTIVMRTVEGYEDLKMVFNSNEEARNYVGILHDEINRNEIVSKILFNGEVVEE